jgi:hypothetical protein
VLVPRAAVAAAMELWRGLGWTPEETAMPLERLLRCHSRVRFTHPGGGQAALLWRLLSRPPDVASEFERLDSFPEEWMGTELRVPLPHLRLLELLIRPGEPSDLLTVWEALTLLEQPIDWPAFGEALQSCPLAGQAHRQVNRLSADWGVRVPLSGAAPQPASRRFLARMLLADYRRWRAQGMAPPPCASLGQYLKLRWGVCSVAQVVALAPRVLLRR